MKVSGNVEFAAFCMNDLPRWATWHKSAFRFSYERLS